MASSDVEQAADNLGEASRWTAIGLSPAAQLLWGPLIALVGWFGYVFSRRWLRRSLPLEPSDEPADR